MAGKKKDDCLTMAVNYELSLAEAKWIESAVSRDGHRKVLTVAALADYNGEVVIAATDTHRLHIVHLGTRAQKGFKPALLDIRRIVLEARFAKATHVEIASDLSAVTVKTVGKKGVVKEASTIYAPVFDTVPGPYPNFVKVMPCEPKPPTEHFAINARYWSDATALAHTNAHRVTLLTSGANAPLLIQPAVDSPRWQSLVMPMASDMKKLCDLKEAS